MNGIDMDNLDLVDPPISTSTCRIARYGGFRRKLKVCDAYVSMTLCNSDPDKDDQAAYPSFDRPLEDCNLFLLLSPSNSEANARYERLNPS